MNMELITIICSFTTVILFILITWSVAKDYVKINQETNRLTEKTINLNTDLNIDTLDSILSRIITDSINEFLVTKGHVEGTYISNETEKDIMTFVIDNITTRMSNVIYDRMKVFYREDAIPDVIAKKVYMQVVLFVAQNNVTKQQKNK